MRDVQKLCPGAKKFYINNCFEKKKNSLLSSDQQIGPKTTLTTNCFVHGSSVEDIAVYLILLLIGRFF